MLDPLAPLHCSRQERQLRAQRQRRVRQRQRLQSELEWRRQPALCFQILRTRTTFVVASECAQSCGGCCGCAAAGVWQRRGKRKTVRHSRCVAVTVVRCCSTALVTSQRQGTHRALDWCARDTQERARALERGTERTDSLTCTSNAHRDRRRPRRILGRSAQASGREIEGEIRREQVTDRVWKRVRKFE